MKKVVIYTILMIAFFIMPNSLKAEVSTYQVYVLNNKSEKLEITEFTDYKEALKKFNSYPKDIDNVPIIEKNSVLVNAKYAIVKIMNKEKDFIFLYNNEALNEPSYTYVDGNFGVDAAFLDYSDKYNSVKIKISGCTGWTSLNNIKIVPLSTISEQFITINTDNAMLKSEATLSSDDIKILQHNAPYIWTQKKVIDNITWYHISETGTDGWINNDLDNTKLTEVKLPNVNFHYVSFNEEKEDNPFTLRHYYGSRSSGIESYSWFNLGLSPEILLPYKYYYSFDGNYFYTDFLTMIDDYKTNTFKNSINETKPYFNYYQYLPTHSKTGYTADNFNQIIKDFGYTSGPKSNITYISDKGVWTDENRENISMMYNEGANFIESQETYGVNALLTFSIALNESGRGTSAIAFAKKNLFGHGAFDYDPFPNATTYSTVKEGILTHARDYSGGGYSNPNDYRYFGSHYGNKGSGMNVKYGSDPYWGEKAAIHAYNRDALFGGQDYLSNTIGVKITNEAVPIKKEPSDASDTIYIIRNKNTSGDYFLVDNVPFIVTDRVTDENNINWYKVYTDVALDDDKNITASNYSFDKSYGYIKEKYLYVSNNQPTIIASDVTIEQGLPYNFLTNVTASDKEDGNLTSKIEYNDLPTNKDGVFYLTYNVTDSMNFKASKTIKVTIYESNKPVITASNKEVLQNTTFDPMNGVSVEDPNEGNVTSKIKISSKVDISKVGTYKVIYSITNAMNITVTKEITVNVLSNAKPVIRATDVHMNINDNLTYLENVSARDLEDGIIDSKVKVTHNIDKTKAGTYNITYEVKDSNDNIVKKSVKAFVTNNTYTTKKGELYFNSLKYNVETNLLEVSGSLAIIGIDNTKEADIKYDLILKNNTTNYEVILPLSRYLDNHPATIYGDTKHKYTETWFKGSVSLKDVKKGEYTLYVRARSGNYESKSLFNNIFLKTMTKKAIDSDGRGYLFRNNNYIREFPLELFIYENGLISTKESPSTANMFNNYSSIELSNKYLNIIGNSFNINGDYNKNSNITRQIIFENITTEKRYSYEIGSIIGEELILKTNDGLSKVRSWFDTKGKVDISKLPVGRYIIYIRTSNSKVDDFGELQDIFLKTTNSVTIDGKKYSLVVNQKNRFRVELVVE